MSLFAIRTDSKVAEILLTFAAHLNRYYEQPGYNDQLFCHQCRCTAKLKCIRKLLIIFIHHIMAAKDNIIRPIIVTKIQIYIRHLHICFQHNFTVT